MPENQIILYYFSNISAKEKVSYTVPYKEAKSFKLQCDIFSHSMVFFFYTQQAYILILIFSSERFLLHSPGADPEILKRGASKSATMVDRRRKF